MQFYRFGNNIAFAKGGCGIEFTIVCIEIIFALKTGNFPSRAPGLRFGYIQVEPVIRRTHYARNCSVIDSCPDRQWNPKKQQLTTSP